MLFVVPLLAAVLCVGVSAPASAAKLPARLTDAEFWTLIADLSEPNGTFRSENLLSNEARFQFVVPDLVEGIRPGGVYLGVGPEQNFTYIAAVKPAIAFIVDVRRGNLDLHLMYKALFELSREIACRFRVTIVLPQAPGWSPPRNRPRRRYFPAYAAAVEPSDGTCVYQRNLKDIQRQLASRHAFPLTADDVGSVEHVYGAFYEYGPAIQYSSNEGLGSAYQPTYVDLMLATDTSGRPRGYLTSEAAFAYVKELEARNLVVPVVGNFAGPKALRAVGAYLKRHQSTVSVFYLSNVEQYLRLQRSWNTFCANVAALPLDDMSMFVRAGHGGRVARGTAMTAELQAIAAEVDNCGGR